MQLCIRRDVKKMGKKIGKILREDDVGSIGIGAMIVFIAMVLVAGIAASVLVQTANRLEIRAMTTGQETEAEVATGLHVVDISGYRNNTAGHKIIYLGITVEPWAGSKEVDLSTTYVEISDTVTKNVLTYDSSDHHVKADINGDLFTASFYDALDGTDFGVIVLADADSSCTSTSPVLNRGDIVMLTVRCGDTATWTFGRDLPERTDVWGMVQAEDGAPGVFSFRTPASYTDQIYDLY